MKTKILLTSLIFTFIVELTSQTTKYRISFTDKIGSPYSISNPSAFLTARAIQRRANQGISIQINDLPPNPNYISQIESLGAIALHQSRWFNSVTVSISNPSTLASIQLLPFVQSTKAVNKIKSPLPIDYKNSIKNSTQNELTKKTKLELLNNYDYGNSFAQVQQLGGDCMHNQGYDGKNMVICILDAGFLNVDTLSCFDSLWINNKILGTYDFVANEVSVFEDYQHGTEVLSCIGANWPGKLVGTAPQAHFWLLRTEDAATELIIEEDNWVAGAEFADSVGADIINSSLGYTTFDAQTSNQNHTRADLDGNTAYATNGADIAAAKGILVCNSAGNEGGSGWKYISIPADGDSVCTVGAVDILGVRAGFSSQGPTADNRIKPDVVACGSGTAVIDPFTSTVAYYSGTSFSSPLTAGMAACLWQANPTKNNMNILNAMRNSGSKSNSPDTLLGWGIPNYCLANGLLSGIHANSTETEDKLFNVFFDASTESFDIYFFSKDNEEITITVHNILGGLHLKETIKVKANAYNFFKLQNTYNIAGGIYLVSINTLEKKYVKKILKY